MRDHIVNGLQNKQIAREISLIKNEPRSHRTVECHRLSIFRKYGVDNAVQLTRLVYDLPPSGNT